MEEKLKEETYSKGLQNTEYRIGVLNINRGEGGMKREKWNGGGSDSPAHLYSRYAVSAE